MFDDPKRKPPGPHELRVQMQGAAVAMTFISEMRKHYPTFWAESGDDVLETLRRVFYEKQPKHLDADTLWALLLTQKPDRKLESQTDSA
jgi:hypothetical protein